jgi:hypothetical protein
MSCYWPNSGTRKRYDIIAAEIKYPATAATVPIMTARKVLIEILTYPLLEQLSANRQSMPFFCIISFSLWNEFASSY